MQTLSLAMIVKNEELTLERILDNARTFCDELVVVDTGSTDNTVEIARQAGAKVHHFAWINDFAAARNESFRHCTSDWIIWLDADDLVNEASQQAIRGYKESLLHDPKHDAIFLPYAYGRTRLVRERLLRRSANFRWRAPVHEVIVVPRDRGLMREDAFVEHATHADNMPRKVGRNLTILENWYASARDLRLLYLYGSELIDNKRPAEAAAILEEYCAKSTKPDFDGERYWALIRLADAYKMQRLYEQGAKAAMRAIELDGRRAEGYCILGLIHMAQEKWQLAWPVLMAAASTHPPKVIGAQMMEFHNEVPRQQLAICFEKLGRPDFLRERLQGLLPEGV